MSSKAYAERLSRSLEATDLVQVVNATHGDNQVRILCRVHEGAEGRWIGLVKQLLLATEDMAQQPYSWQAHVCRLYFLKGEQEKKLVFGWNVSIHSQDLSTSLDAVSRVLRGETAGIPKVPGEVEEMEFTGVSKERGPNRRGKGGYPLTGPDAFRPPLRR